jgi:DeoR/GlpR family transcriptional regulator of sugar metabolism
MKRLERQRAILTCLARQGDLSLDEVCRTFAISPATARRDFVEIVSRGAAEKIWGGLRRIAAPAAGGDPIPSDQRESIHVAQKERIARAAAALVQDGDVLLIDGGTTTLGLAPHLANRPVRILTNSLLIAHRIDRLRTAQAGAEVFLTGGFVYPGSGLLVGPQAVANLADYHARWAFLSCGGLDANGATNTHQLVVESERAMIRSADTAVVLADASKWAHRDMIRAFAWSDVAYLVTDAPPPQPLANVQVRLAS